jgi:hypothetical protein
MNDDDLHQSADDALEPQDDIFNPNIDEERLAEDNDSPAAPAIHNQHHLPPDHPATDSGIDADELYSEGIGEATDIDEDEILPRDEVSPLDS